MKRCLPYPVLVAACACLPLAYGSGCSPYADYCAAKAECLGGNDTDITACKEEMSGKAGYYLAYDCSEHWDVYFACLDTDSRCVGTAAGGKSWSDCDGEGLACRCADEENKLLKCVENSSGYYEHAEPAPATSTSTTTSG